MIGARRRFQKKEMSKLYFNFGNLEVLVDGRLEDTVELSKSPKDTYKIISSNLLQPGIYSSVEEVIVMIENKVKKNYTEFRRLFMRYPEIKIVDKTNGAKNRNRTF